MLEGAIAGRALYDGRLDPRAALALLSRPSRDGTPTIMTTGFSERAQEPFGDIPTEPDAFLLWSSHRKREEGKFELSRGRVIRRMINVSRGHARVCTNILGELLRLDRQLFDVGAADFAVRTAVGIRSPDVVGGAGIRCRQLGRHASLHRRSAVAVDDWDGLHREIGTNTRQLHPCRPISSAAKTSRARGSGRDRATGRGRSYRRSLSVATARSPGRSGCRPLHGRHLPWHSGRADARLIAPCSRSASSPAST